MRWRGDMKMLGRERAQELGLLHLTPTIGTEVSGIDLGEPLSNDTFEYLSRLLLARKVIFFRDQRISVEDQIRFARNWGELEVIPFLPQHPDHPEVLTMRRGGTSSDPPAENVWHADITWMAEPPLGAVLRAVVVPDLGGDTLFCDMAAAYEGLTTGMKGIAEGLTAIHSLSGGFRQYPSLLGEIAGEFPPQEHPVVRVHPETGQRVLFVNSLYVEGLVGFSDRESRALLDLLIAHTQRPEYQCRFRWTDNAVAFWDNRACQHYASADFLPRQRDMDRVTIRGDRPVGV